MEWTKDTIGDSIVVFTLLPLCLIILLTALRELKEKYYDEVIDDEPIKDKYHGEGL